MAFAAQGGVVWAHADSLRRDEDGRLDPTRRVQLTNTRIAAGRGALEWYFGWSIPTRWEPGTSTHRFEQLIRGMGWVRPAEGVMPLVNGELRFHGDEDLDFIRTVQIVHGSGTITRAWSGDGSPLSWTGISISSPGQLFVMRDDSGAFRVSGDGVRVTSSAPISAILRKYPHYELTKRADRTGTIIEPQGWQRGYWFELLSP